MCFNILICYQIRLEKEREEKERRKKEKAEAHLYTIVKVFKSTSWADNISYYIPTGILFLPFCFLTHFPIV
jgi:cadmium resistance protein CadD (predicted permease)